MTAFDVDMQVLQDVASGAVNYQGVVGTGLVRPIGRQHRSFLIERAHIDPVFLVNGLALEHVRWWESDIHLPYEDGLWIAFTTDFERTSENISTLPGFIQKEAKPRPRCTVEYAVHVYAKGEKHFVCDVAYFDPLDPLGPQTMMGAVHIEMVQRNGVWKVDWEANVDHAKGLNRTPAQVKVINEYFTDDALLRVNHALNAISVLNARRVTVVPASVPRRWAKKAERKPSHRVNYRLLVLPDGTKTNGHKAFGNGVSEVALHTVRGHFATYSADRPLFGQHTGTVWRKSHVRGSKSAGVLLKDYTVEDTHG